MDLSIAKGIFKDFVDNKLPQPVRVVNMPIVSVSDNSTGQLSNFDDEFARKYLTTTPKSDSRASKTPNNNSKISNQKQQQQADWPDFGKLSQAGGESKSRPGTGTAVNFDFSRVKSRGSDRESARSRGQLIGGSGGPRSRGFSRGGGKERLQSAESIGDEVNKNSIVILNIV